MRLRVVSYNVHSCLGSDGRYAPSRILDVLSLTQAEVIALQEVDSSLDVEEGRDQLEFLAERSGMSAVMGPTLRRDYGAYGNAFLSRHPLSDVFEMDLTYRRFEPRGLLCAKTQVQGQTIRLMNTHLGLKAWERRFQVRRLFEAVFADHRLPTVIMGDFNEWFRWSWNERQLKRSFGSPGRALTFPSRWPRFALDRIYVYPSPRKLSLRVLNDELSRSASDHLPILADIEF